MAMLAMATMMIAHTTNEDDIFGGDVDDDDGDDDVAGDGDGGDDDDDDYDIECSALRAACPACGRQSSCRFCME